MSEQGNGSVLRVSDLVVARGGRSVVRGVSLDIEPGKVTTLLGPNGAGKSSLVLAIGGVLRPASGSVMLDGKDLAGRRPEKIRGAGVAIVPEGRRLLTDLTVEDNIRVATYSLPRSQAQAERARALELFPELSRLLQSRARSLSGGEQQMVVLAQAIVSRPRFMIIDELSLGLAPVVVQRLIPVIRDVAEAGIGVLLIEQFAHVALGLADQAHVMEGGRLQFSGSTRELTESPDLLHTAYLASGAVTGNGASVPTPPVSPAPAAAVASADASAEPAAAAEPVAPPQATAPAEPVAPADAPAEPVAPAKATAPAEPAAPAETPQRPPPEESTR